MKQTFLIFCSMCAGVLIMFQVELFAYKLSDTVYTQNGGTATLTNKQYVATGSDQSGIYVSGNGILNLSNSTIITIGNTSSTDSSMLYGLNAGVLANDTSTINLTGCSITTKGKGAAGVFASGSGSFINLVNDTINCFGQSSCGIGVVVGAKLELTHVIVNTTGTNSPGIESQGLIKVNGATISAQNYRAANIVGTSSINLVNTSLSGAGIYMGPKTDNYSFISEHGVFKMTGGSLIGTEDPLFYVSTSEDTISLTNVTVSAVSGALIYTSSVFTTMFVSIGQVTFIGDTVDLTGNLVVGGAYCSITSILRNSSTLTGYITGASLTIDASSKWNVTANSTLTFLTEISGTSSSTLSNIIDNGYTIYYDKNLIANSWLGGNTYALSGGGQLTPIKASNLDDYQDIALKTFVLSQNYPNPFNPSTTINYEIPKSGLVQLKIYDILGREVQALVNENQSAGKHTVVFDSQRSGKQLSSGVYFFRLKFGSNVLNKKMVLLR